MAHFSKLLKIVIDVPPAVHDRELAFWSAATGQALSQSDRHPGYHGAALHGQDRWLLIQRPDEGQGRVHIDIHTDDPAAEMARLEKLGAEVVQQALLVGDARSGRAAVLHHSGKTGNPERQQRPALGLTRPGSGRA